jgi:hypothetical protein
MNVAPPTTTNATGNNAATSTGAAAGAASPSDGAPPPFVIEERVVETEDLTKYGDAAAAMSPEGLDGSLAKRGPEWIAALAHKGTSGTTADDFRNGLPKSPSPECAAWATRLLETYGKGQEPPELDVLADAAAAHALLTNSFAPYLLARGGARFFAEVLVASYDVRSCWYGGQGGSGQYFETGKGLGIGRTVELARWARSALDAKGQEEASDVFVKARAGAELDLKIALTIATRNTDWAREDAAAFLAAKKASMSWEVPRWIFATLRDPELATRLAERDPRSVPEYVLVRVLGLAAAPILAVPVERDPSNAWSATALSSLECVTAARALAQTLAKKGGAADVAKAYFKRRPDLGILALAPIVAAEGKLAPFAKPELEAIVRAHPDLPSRLAEHLDPKSKALFARAAAQAAKPVKVADASALPLALATFPAPRKGGKSAGAGSASALPEFAAVDRLPSVLLRTGEALPPSACANLLGILQQSTLTDPHPALRSVREACDPASLAAFVWGLFEAWLAASGSSKDGWAFTALGLLGGDEAARRLTPYIRAWPGESQHARAVTGLSVLEAIGTDVALMFLHGVSQKVKFKGLQEKARQKVAAIAASRGLTPEELADRLVPDLGLDDRGSLSLDFGARTFTVGFDEALKPFVRDANGKVLADLPKPNKSDDSEKAAAAVAAWKTLKKDAKEVASGQITRFELAMCSQARWRASDFKTLIVGHPLVGNLARRLVFGVFEGPKLTTTFRVSEDRSLANEEDAQISIGLDARVGIVHRLDLDEALLTRWGQIFADYVILQPFDQLGRQVYTPTKEEQTSDAILRMKGVSVKTGKVLGLEHRGWHKGEPQDAGWIYWMVKPLPGQFKATLGLDGGICVGYMEGTPPEQKLEGVHIEGTGRKKAKISQLSPIAFSELVRDVEQLRG